ncbi:hypothetical protein NMY22_g14676 [Coprinellus aureogranulatus]|nr:hypothetical protein NMY22_g14676 [Coprinellus aureogranulatus]
MNETLREKEEAIRIEAENLRKANDELAVLRRKVDQHNELMSEKDRTVQILHDEISTAPAGNSGRIEERNQTLNCAITAKVASANGVDEVSAPSAPELGKRGSSPQSPYESEGWSVIPDGQDGGSDTEWLIVDDEKSA